jgi:NitT/TauT family transport system substrate-binding protein
MAPEGEMNMSKFVIQLHGRLQEMIAHEKGYFSDEGLDYEISESKYAQRAKEVDPSTGEVKEIKSGAYQSYEKGQGNKGEERSDISCACHWTVNNAAANELGTMVGQAYVMSPGAIMVPQDSPIKTPEDLAGTEIAVGYQSGSHYSTIQAMETFLDPGDINIKFVGLPWQRVDLVNDGDLPAASLWGLTYLVGEQMGLRKVVDCSFMMTFMFPDGVGQDDITKYFNALKRAQTELDLRPELYLHHYNDMIPERYRDKIDVRIFNAGERIVFLPYTQEVFDRTQSWIHERGIFDEKPEYDYSLSVSS